MKEFRLGNGTTEHYTSLEALREGFGLSPVVRRTKDENKLKAQQEKFLGVCKVCKQPMSLIDGCNVLACKNETCKGIKMTSKNEEDGTEKVWYIPVTRVLDEKGATIAHNLFN